MIAFSQSTSPKSLRIVVAEDDADTRQMYALLFDSLGHTVIGQAATGLELVALCNELRPDLVIADIKMPGMDGIQASDAIAKLASIPVILVSGCFVESVVQRAGLSNIMAYLVKPVSAESFKAAITVAMQRFEEFMKLLDEACNLRQALRDRKVIERAKGILMQKADLCESAAFRRLQELSWNRNEKLVKIAENIVLASSAMSSE